MADTWQTIEQAAVTLGLSVRTVNRHITNGKLQSRLFEGRREVLVTPQAELLAEKIAPSSASSPFSPTHDPVTSASDGSAKSSPPDAPIRQQVTTADGGADRPLDLQQTMLALADSMDDKASLAVAAYQTLARSAEIQVQSLRRTAFGAWAAVGILAVGVIVGIGWGTLRLTKAEMTTDKLNEKLSEQSDHLKSVTADRDAARAALNVMKDEQTTELRNRVDWLAEQNRREAQQAAIVLREAVDAIRSTTRSATTADAAITASANIPSTTSPTTRPATAPSATHPTTTPILSSTRPATFANPKPLVPGQPTDVPDRR